MYKRQVSALPALKVVPEPDDSQVVIDSSEDGFVELTEFAAGPEVREPAAVQTHSGTSGLASAGKPMLAKAGNVFIQLGAFSQANNAYALVDTVDEQTGLPAFVEKDANRSLYRVKMGPFKKGAHLDNTLSELAGFGIEGYTLQSASR